MTRDQHILTIVAEECAEIAQRASKAARFGLDEIQPDEIQNAAGLNNAERLIEEFHDLVGALEMLDMTDVVLFTGEVARDARRRKRLKIEKYLDLSKKLGMVTE